MSERMRSRWVNFARHGEPSGSAGDPEWPAYVPDDRATLVIDKQDSVIDDLDADVRSAWGDDVLSFL